MERLTEKNPVSSIPWAIIFLVAARCAIAQQKLEKNLNFLAHGMELSRKKSIFDFNSVSRSNSVSD